MLVSGLGLHRGRGPPVAAPLGHGHGDNLVVQPPASWGPTALRWLLKPMRPVAHG